jgi:hypothetical protein
LKKLPTISLWDAKPHLPAVSSLRPAKSRVLPQFRTRTSIQFAARRHHGARDSTRGPQWAARSRGLTVSRPLSPHPSAMHAPHKTWASPLELAPAFSRIEELPLSKALCSSSSVSSAVVRLWYRDLTQEMSMMGRVSAR